MNEGTRRRALIAGAIVLGLLSIGAGALIAVSDDGPDRASPTPTTPTSPTPGGTPPETPSSTPSGSPSLSVSPMPGVIEDGRHFVSVTDVARLEDGSATVTFDLAYFLTGEEGEASAAAHGDEFVGGYYIENDNPRLRTLPLAADVRIRYIVAERCCELERGDVETWLGTVLGDDSPVYAGEHASWWLTVRDGLITRIEQQYLP